MHANRHAVLLVDPDALFAERVADRLSSHGYTVRIAANLRQAVQGLTDVDFCCAILDEAAMGMAGDGAVPILKAIWPKIPVIVTAARNSPEQETRIRRQEILYYHLKGFDMHEIEMAVDDASIGNLTVQREWMQ